MPRTSCCIRTPEPLFTKFGIERQLNAMFSPYVTLKSGGYLVINQTEALVAIDVNSGKSTREFSIEETALNTNLEASDEIARQLKLRDLAGLIVIDFIDMEEKRNNRAVERRLKDALRFDRARIQLGRISHFGLMEMSRQRLRSGVLEGSTSQCPHCQGTGIIRSTESVALAVLRGLEDALMAGARTSLVATTTAQVALYILNNKRHFITEMETRHGMFIAVQASDKLQGANFLIEKGAAPPSAVRRPSAPRSTWTGASRAKTRPPLPTPKLRATARRTWSRLMPATRHSRARRAGVTRAAAAGGVAAAAGAAITTLVASAGVIAASVRARGVNPPATSVSSTANMPTPPRARAASAATTTMTAKASPLAPPKQANRAATNRAAPDAAAAAAAAADGAAAIAGAAELIRRPTAARREATSTPSAPAPTSRTARRTMYRRAPSRNPFHASTFHASPSPARPPRASVSRARPRRSRPSTPRRRPRRPSWLRPKQRRLPRRQSRGREIRQRTASRSSSASSSSPET